MIFAVHRLDATFTTAAKSTATMALDNKPTAVSIFCSLIASNSRQQ